MSKCTNEEMGKMGKLDDNKEEERKRNLENRLRCKSLAFLGRGLVLGPCLCRRTCRAGCPPLRKESAMQKVPPRETARAAVRSGEGGGGGKGWPWMADGSGSFHTYRPPSTTVSSFACEETKQGTLSPCLIQELHTVPHLTSTTAVP